MKVQAYGGPHDGATMSVRRGTNQVTFPVPQPLGITGWTLDDPAWDEPPEVITLPVVIANGRHYVVNPPYWPNDALMEEWLEGFA